MKRWNFSKLAIGCILLFTVDVKAEGPVEYSAVESSSRGINTGDYMVNLLSPEMPVTLESPIVYDKPQKTIYQRRTEGYKSFWNKIIPRYAKVQFAGGMGVVSWGVGWDYGKKRQWETDIMMGVLPKFSGDRSCITFTLKQNYIPWDVTIGKKLIFEPLTTGLYINKLTARNFWGREPEKYGDAYYKFSTNTRASIFLGQRLTLGLESSKFAAHKSITFFYEFSSNDLYIISALNNRSLHLDQILVLSLGIKFQFL